jgi:hypothetical protein
MDLRAWKYDRRLFCLTGSEVVHPFRAHDRLIYELPDFSTLVEPPFAEPGQVPVFVDKTDRWVLVSDHRGERGWVNWKGEEITILRLGDPSHWGLKRREPEGVA